MWVLTEPDADLDGSHVFIHGVVTRGVTTVSMKPTLCFFVSDYEEASK